MNMIISCNQHCLYDWHIWLALGIIGVLVRIVFEAVASTWRVPIEQCTWPFCCTYTSYADSACDLVRNTALCLIWVTNYRSAQVGMQQCNGKWAWSISADITTEVRVCGRYTCMKCTKISWQHWDRKAALQNNTSTRSSRNLSLRRRFGVTCIDLHHERYWSLIILGGFISLII